MNFSDLDLIPQVQSVLKQKKFSSLTQIQELAIPEILNKKDIVGLSQTGTGKTLAFVLPILQNLEKQDYLEALILCPTRELVLQIKQEIKEYSKNMHDVRVVAVYGGADIKQQIFALKRRPSIVVGTPGRVIDHLKRHTLKLGNIKTLVLDEADEMLNMGFRNDILSIIKKTPQDRQTLLFSATMNDEVLSISKDYMINPKVIKVGKQNTTLDSISQTYFLVPKDKKKKALHALLMELERGRTLIFCNTKNMVGQVQLYLEKMGYKPSVLHGDMPQSQRTRVMNEYKSGKVDILITTDVSARGIDVQDILHVVNFDLPQNLENYIHRIGRTGRAGKQGYAWTILNSDDQQQKIKQIEKISHSKIVLKRIQLEHIEETKQTKSLIENQKPKRFKNKRVQNYNERKVGYKNV